MDGWNTTFLLGMPIFRGYVSFREGITHKYPLYTAYIGISYRGTLVGVHPTIPWHLAANSLTPYFFCLHLFHQELTNIFKGRFGRWNLIDMSRQPSLITVNYPHHLPQSDSSLSIKGSSRSFRITPVKVAPRWIALPVSTPLCESQSATLRCVFCPWDPFGHRLTWVTG